MVFVLPFFDLQDFRVERPEILQSRLPSIVVR